MAPMWFYSDTLTYTPGNDSFTKILMHFDGANGGTTFTDTNAGGSTHTWSVGAGSPTTSTATFKFGTASFLSGSTTGYISTPDSADFTLGSVSWTVDCWVNRGSVTGAITSICGQSGTGAAAATSILIYIDASNKINCFTSNGSAYTTTTSAATVTDSNWHHIAVIRNGNSIQIYLDGTATGSASSFTVSVNDSAANFMIGSYLTGGTNCFQKNIDEFRLSVGVARWTTNFTPPTLPYGPG